MYRWLVYLHVLGGLGFMLAHGASAWMAFQIRREREIPRLRALLDMSGATAPVLFVSLLLLLLSGILAGFVGHWWSEGWIWVSLGLLIGISVAMGNAARTQYHELRRVVGLPYMLGNKQMQAEQAGDAAQIEALLQAHRPRRLSLWGLLGTTLIIWLMMFKPF
jgi:hypothetical protein